MDEELELNERQKEILAEYHEDAAAAVDWINNMPADTRIAKAFILAIIASRDSDPSAVDVNAGVSSEEIERLVNWLRSRIIDLSLISSVLTGHVGVKLAEGEKEEPTFWLTPKGQAEAKEMDE
jgi:hypothetical protein